jgi:hypothetical protein
MSVFVLFIFAFLGTAADLAQAPAPAVYGNITLPLATVDGISIQFPPDYVSARERFRAKAAKLKTLFPKAELGSYKVPSRIDKDLSTDFLFIPAPHSKKLVIVTSGIHGAEAMTGHTLQMWLFEKLLKSGKAPNYNLLVIHALNPYGFKYFRRTNENNVDLNRNFATKEDFKSSNKEYEKLQYLLEPQYIATGYSLTRIGFYAKVAAVNLYRGHKFILGSLRGQYQFPKGIFYGGTELQPETKFVQKLIQRFADEASDIYHVDIHTGFGAKGKLHYFGSERLAVSPNAKDMQKVFKDRPIETSKDEDFYATNGDFGDWLFTAYPKKRVLPMTFEFGTMDSHTLSGGLKSLWTTVLENQGFHLGFLSTEDQKISRTDFEALFNPQSQTWQNQVLEGGTAALTDSLKNFETL